MMIEGSGTIRLTNGSGTPKNMWTRIRNTDLYGPGPFHHQAKIAKKTTISNKVCGMNPRSWIRTRTKMSRILNTGKYEREKGVRKMITHLPRRWILDSTRMSLNLASLSFLFRSRCLRMETAFLMRKYMSSGRSGARALDFRMRRILLPVMKRTWRRDIKDIKNTLISTLKHSGLRIRILSSGWIPILILIQYGSGSRAWRKKL